jgi:ATP-dependent Clp protease adaptor protein ClpS
MGTHKGGNGQGPGTRENVAVREKPKVKKPQLYKVLLHNDDYTTMEFVIDVLIRFFEKSRTDATRIMLHVHHTDIGIAGVYTYDVGETKVKLVHEYAASNGHPLKCSMEPE